MYYDGPNGLTVNNISPSVTPTPDAMKAAPPLAAAAAGGAGAGAPPGADASDFVAIR